MVTFDNFVIEFLLEEAPTYDFDIKKVFYVRPDSEQDFKNTLKKYGETEPIPLPSGHLPAKKPLFQAGTLAGRLADSRLFASLLLNYFNEYGSPLKPKEILRNAQVKPNDIALYNFYEDVNKHFGKFLEYKLPGKEKEKEEKEKEEPFKFISYKGPSVNYEPSVEGTFTSGFFKGLMSGGRRKKRR